MQRTIHPNTPWDIRSDTLLKETMSPQVVEGAVVRLCWICIICAAISTFSIFFQSWLQPEIAGIMKHPLVFLSWIVVLLMSLAIAVLRRYRLLSPLTLLHLGLAFEVIVAFAISFSETALPLATDRPVLGSSKLALWIASVGFLIPNKPRIKLAVAFLSASMWPLAYTFNLFWYGFEPLPLNRFLVWVHVPYLMVFVTYAIAKRLYVMESAAQTAQELGSYNLISLIGSGGMGEVWRASHRMLARHAAVKLIRNDLMISQPGYQSEIIRKRFKREAQAIASLQSPHTVYLFDFGVSQNGSFYYVMELLDGISLQMLVDKFGPQPAGRVVHFLKQVCLSLEEAHRRGLIHRDIKSNNIFACNVGIEYDFIKVLDFGLVKNISPLDSLTITLGGTTAGTPAFMAPEVAMGEEGIDGRVDIYGLGCVAYFLLTGFLVFEEKSATATALAHVQKPPQPPSQRCPLVIPQQLESIVLRCLAKKPEDRPQSAQELFRMLEECGVPSWTQEDARKWWQTYLPASSDYRIARQSPIVELGSMEPA